MDAVLELAGVTVRRGESTLISDVDWTVEEDERWVVLGPNGAGKTTLLQVAAAQIHPTTGVAGVVEAGTSLHPRGEQHREACGQREAGHRTMLRSPRVDAV